MLQLDKISLSLEQFREEKNSSSVSDFKLSSLKTCILLLSHNNGAIPNNHLASNRLCLSLQQLLADCKSLGYVFEKDTVGQSH